MLEELFALKSTYFNTSYLGPMPRAAKAALDHFSEQYLDPSPLTGLFEFDDDVRSSFARLLGVPSERIALSTSVSELVSHIANGFALGPSDEILLMDGEYPSLVLPWLLQAERKGFSLRFGAREDFLDPDRFRRALTKKTRYAACSHVMFNTGTRLPVAELGRIARENGVLFLVDTSQSFGGMALSRDIVESVDILVGVAYKWLLGPYGSAYGCFTPEALGKLERTHASWLHAPGAKNRENLLNYTTATAPGARRFDRGETAAFLNNVALKASLDLLFDIGLDKIEAHNRELTLRFLDGLPAGVQVLNPRETLSNIVCLKTADPIALKDRLGAQNIMVSVREGVLRASFHVFNSPAQVDALLRALELDANSRAKADVVSKVGVFRG